MKKIINGKLYDTEKAKELGHWANMGDRRDSRQVEETLYRKRTGEYFLHGEGGALTKYAVTIDDNNWSGGEKIIPLSAGKAREWAEEHLDADEYAGIFGMPGEGEDVEALNIQIDAALMARIRARAAEDRASLTATVERLLRTGLEN